MSYSNIETLLEFNKDSNQKSTLANTSELEIKNLLKQVDSMIYHKKLRWERQKQELDNKLNIKEREYLNQKAELEQKNTEIVQLKSLLENMESTTQEIMKKYDQEISLLTLQLDKLKIDYAKLQKKYKKNIKRGSGGSAGCSGETTNQQANSWQLESTSHSRAGQKEFIQQIESSECLSSTAFPTVRHQTGKENERCLSAKDGNLLNKNNNNGKSLFQYETEIERLNGQLTEHKRKEMELHKENENLNGTISTYKRMNTELVKKLEELGGLRASRDNEPIVKNSAEFYRQEIRKRDEHIRDLEALDKADNIEIQYYKDEIKKYKRQELSFKKQIDEMRVNHEESAKRVRYIEDENKKIKVRIQQSEEKAKSEETLKEKYELEKDRHLEEISNLKAELSIYLGKLNEKNGQIKVLSEKSNCLEQLLKEKESQLTKSNEELIMTVAHVEALRLENHFLRQSLVEKKSDEKEVVQMQKQYNQVLDLTEKENKRLKNEIIELTSTVEALKAKLNTMSSKQSGQKSVSGNDFEMRRASQLREEYEKQMSTLKKQHELSVKRLTNEIEKLYSEKNALLAEFDGVNNKLNGEKGHKINRSNMSSIHGGDSISVGVLSMSNANSMHNQQHQQIRKDDEIPVRKIRSPNNNLRAEESASFAMQRNADFSNNMQKQFPRFNIDFETIENSPAKSRLSLASELRHDEQYRKRDLEHMLDDHIESLRRSSGEQNGKKDNLNNFI